MTSPFLLPYPTHARLPHLTICLRFLTRTPRTLTVRPQLAFCWCAAIEWSPGPDEGTVVCGPPTATLPAGAAIDLTKPAVQFCVLRHEGRFAEDPQAEVLRRLESADGSAEQRFRERGVGAALTTARLEPELDMAQSDMNPHTHYPWAVEMKTSDGVFKTKYNVSHGTVLQPLPQVEPSLTALERKRAFAANPRVSASVGPSHGASGSMR